MVHNAYQYQDATYEFGKPAFVLPSDWKSFTPKNGCGSYDWVPDCWLTDKNIMGFIFEDTIVFINKKTLLDLENSSLYSVTF